MVAGTELAEYVVSHRETTLRETGMTRPTDRRGEGAGAKPTVPNPIDEYLARLDEPKRNTLTALRDVILSIVPEAEQCISYGMPAFRLHGKVIAGFAAFTHHLSYLPHSGSVISKLQKETASYASTPGSLHFALDTPLPRALVEKLIAVRIEEALPPGQRR